MTLSEIKASYAGKCAKCNREIKVGWTVVFDSDSKKVYCKPCGTPMITGTKSQPAQLAPIQQDNSTFEMLINELMSTVNLCNEMLNQMAERVIVIETNIGVILATFAKQNASKGKSK